MDEEELLQEIFRRYGQTRRDPRVKIGPGDDAALVRVGGGMDVRRPRHRTAGTPFTQVGGGTDVVMTTDAVVDKVDFDLRYCSWSDVGHKAYNAAVSDIYACGAIPCAILVTAGIPRGTSAANTRALLSGLHAAARRHHAPIVGGDITSARELFLDVCAFGQLAGQFKTRSGARPGDEIFVSGRLGAARAGLEMLRRKKKKIHPLLLRSQLRPQAALDDGPKLGRMSCVTAMMDISDGLLIDLSRMCRAGGVRAGIHPSRIPVHPATSAAFRQLGLDPVAESMRGGEDYVLLFTVRPPVPRSIREKYFHIGRILNPVPGKKRHATPMLNLDTNPPAPIAIRGFVHSFQ